ncbi:hypothetical protein HU200_022244 [Digitaria exilis]|uniref:Uncharacterized protein n=1 Tax=Digitaria exilis TaxID=1010633 RepID=A0A835K8G8_9POAL|nr:hypothetical protein HU200_022244 [Digitaria exilis]
MPSLPDAEAVGGRILAASRLPCETIRLTGVTENPLSQATILPIPPCLVGPHVAASVSIHPPFLRNLPKLCKLHTSIFSPFHISSKSNAAANAGRACVRAVAWSRLIDRLGLAISLSLSLSRTPSPSSCRPRSPLHSLHRSVPSRRSRALEPPRNQHPILSLSGRGPLLPPLGSIDMGRAPCCEKEGLRRGAWSPEEDQRLAAYIQQHGHPNWRALPRQAGLLRCGKSCRLRWINYLRPDIKRGNFSADEEALIVRLHAELGNSRQRFHLVWPLVPCHMKILCLIYGMAGAVLRQHRHSFHHLRGANCSCPWTTHHTHCSVHEEELCFETTCKLAESNLRHQTRNHGAFIFVYVYVNCFLLVVFLLALTAEFCVSTQLPGRTDNEIKNVWHTHIKKRLEAADPESNARAKQQKARKGKPAAAKKAIAAAAVESSEQQTFTTASPGLSSISVSSGVTTTTTTFSTATTESTAAVSSGDNAATTSASLQLATKAEMEMESFSSAEFPPIDESFWSSPDVMDMGLGAMDEELVGLAGPPSSSTRDEDMEFWLKMLLEAGDMRDLSVL